MTRIFAPLFCLALVGCGGAQATSTTVSATSLEQGHADVMTRGCPRCHDPGDGSMAGGSTPLRGAVPANLTPDPTTGIGDWTDAQIAGAIRTGIDDQGMSLCSSMPRFSTMSDAEVGDIVAYLRSLAPVKHPIPDSMCSDGG